MKPLVLWLVGIAVMLGTLVTLLALSGFKRSMVIAVAAVLAVALVGSYFALSRR